MLKKKITVFISVLLSEMIAGLKRTKKYKAMFREKIVQIARK